MLATETLHPAPPSAATPAPQAAPSAHSISPSRSEITDAPSFLSALIAARFNFHAVARTVEIKLLRHLMSDPDLMAAITEYARHTAAADAVREAEYRQIALDHLATLIRATPGSPHATTPLETRRAATTILRALAPSREPRFNQSSAGQPAARAHPSPPTRPAAGSSFAASVAASHRASESPPPFPAAEPSPTHTPAQVIDELLTHFAQSTRLTPDTAINYFKRFADHGATLDGIPFPLTDPATPFEILLEAALGTCTGSPRGTIIQPPADQSSPDQSSTAASGANRAQATLFFAPSPSRGPAAINLTLTLARTPSSRAPNCWLITAASLSTTTANQDTS